MQEGFLGEESLGENMWVKSICKKSFWVESFWVKSLCNKSFWVKSLWVKSIWVKSMCKKGFWVKSLWVKNIGEHRDRWDAGFRSPLLRYIYIYHIHIMSPVLGPNGLAEPMAHGCNINHQDANPGLRGYHPKVVIDYYEKRYHPNEINLGGYEFL